VSCALYLSASSYVCTIVIAIIVVLALAQCSEYERSNPEKKNINRTPNEHL
jgi:uncharacterized lipoprotein YehR (DUF1307 family)